jgi:hypothetical protein
MGRNHLVSIKATDPEASESGDAGAFIVSRTGNTDEAVTVNYAVAGTATSGVDYNPLAVTPGTITIAAGKTNAIIPVIANHDYETEGDETLELTLTPGIGYATGTDSKATVTISDSTATSSYGPFVYENPDNGHLYILSDPDTWHGAQAQAQSLGGNLVTINDQAEQDWIEDNFGGQNLWIGLTDSEIYGKTEGDFEWTSGEEFSYTNWKPGEPLNFGSGEDFGSKLTNGQWNDRPSWGAGGEDMPGLIEIDPTTLDKPIVNIQVTDPSAGEDGNAGQLLIQRIGPMAADLTINYSLAGDATNGTDYAELTGTATIPAGKSLLTIPIIALPDNEVEGDETLVVNLESGDYRLGTHGSGHVVLSDQHPINRISNEVIGRDVALLDYWNQRWQDGETLEQLRPAIIAAANDGLGNYEAETKINAIYRDVLGRDADASEIAEQRSRLETGATLSQVRQSLEGGDAIDVTSDIYTHPETGNKYFLTKPDTWLGAQEQAKAAGGNLVTINDAAENQWLFDTLGNGPKWVGLNDSPIYGNAEGEYQWVSGDSATFRNWRSTPNNVLHTPEGEDFTETNFYGVGTWNDMPSQDNWIRYGIVEISDDEPSYNWAWTSFGEDIHTGGNSVRLTNTPETDKARNAFLTNLVNVETVDFESFAHLDNPNSLTFGSTTANLSGSLSVRELATETDGGTFPTSGDKYLLSHNDTSFSIDFSSPQSAFGFTVTDSEGGLFTITLHREDGSTLDATIPVTATWPSNSGSALFFGITDKDAPFTKVTINKPGDTERIGLDDLIIGELKPDLVASPTPANDTFIQPYTEDETLDLVDIIVTDPDGETKVSLTLSDPAAGILQAGAVQSSAAGVWEASGTVTDVNALLANLQFVPAADYNSDLIVALEVNDAISGGGSPLTGTINLQGIDVAEDNAITVVNTNDSGLGSLRYAIEWANSNAGTDTISFNIPTSDPGYNPTTGAFTIQPNSALPEITDSVVIDGTTQAGFSSSPIIELDGTNAGLTANGLTISAGDSTVRSLVINRFERQYGIELKNKGNNTIEGNYIGTDVTGTQDLGNGVGVSVISTANTIGGTTPEARNLISGNYIGVNIFFTGDQNKVMGNYIGTDVTGTKDLGNDSDGITILTASNIIGGTTPESRNLISGNNNAGVSIFGSEAQNNQVLGNYIGTDVTGTQDLGNRNGLYLSGFNNIIGGITPESRNLISGNSMGIRLYGNNNQVMSNYIGTDVTGTQDLGNEAGGVLVLGANNAIGGTTAQSRNLISGNSTGVAIAGENNQVLGNYIGTDVTGTQDLGNRTGVSLQGINNTIGGTTPEFRNIISGNTSYGVHISGSQAQNNQVLGNYIGTDVTGTQSLSNLEGIQINASENIIGGTSPESRNLISGNSSYGIDISGSDAQSNQVLGNYIGTDVTGTKALGNRTGVRIVRPTNTIGGTTVEARNLISGNDFSGVSIESNQAQDNQVLGNYIGTDVTGTQNLGNGSYGVGISRFVSNNTVGGTASGAGNIIAFNGASTSYGDGVSFDDEAGSGNAILSNAIFSNGHLGIDLDLNGVTANDPGDGDTGSNNLQNFPVLTTATSSSGTTNIEGTLNSTPNSTFRLEFFSNPDADAEGQTFLGFQEVTTDGNGDVSFAVNLPISVAAGSYITATATDSNNNTSEFSPGIALS